MNKIFWKIVSTSTTINSAVATAETPNEFLCPISQIRMEDPVLTPNGDSYERVFIYQWITEHSTCPITRKKISLSDLRSNRALKTAIERWETERRQRIAAPTIDEPPNEFLCPISMRLMTDPVTTPNGDSYEKGSISQWVNANKTCPTTRAKVELRDLRINRALKEAIIRWKTPVQLAPVLTMAQLAVVERAEYIKIRALIQREKHRINDIFNRPDFTRSNHEKLPQTIDLVVRGMYFSEIGSVTSKELTKTELFYRTLAYIDYATSTLFRSSRITRERKMLFKVFKPVITVLTDESSNRTQLGLREKQSIMAYLADKEVFAMRGINGKAPTMRTILIMGCSWAVENSTYGSATTKLILEKLARYSNISSTDLNENRTTSPFLSPHDIAVIADANALALLPSRDIEQIGGLGNSANVRLRRLIQYIQRMPSVKKYASQREIETNIEQVSICAQISQVEAEVNRLRREIGMRRQADQGSVYYQEDFFKQGEQRVCELEEARKKLVRRIRRLERPSIVVEIDPNNYRELARAYLERALNTKDSVERDGLYSRPNAELVLILQNIKSAGGPSGREGEYLRTEINTWIKNALSTKTSSETINAITDLIVVVVVASRNTANPIRTYEEALIKIQNGISTQDAIMTLLQEEISSVRIQRALIQFLDSRMSDIFPKIDDSEASNAFEFLSQIDDLLKSIQDSALSNQHKVHFTARVLEQINRNFQLQPGRLRSDNVAILISQWPDNNIRPDEILNLIQDKMRQWVDNAVCLARSYPVLERVYRDLLNTCKQIYEVQAILEEAKWFIKPVGMRKGDTDYAQRALPSISDAELLRLNRSIPGSGLILTDLLHPGNLGGSDNVLVSANNTLRTSRKSLVPQNTGGINDRMIKQIPSVNKIKELIGSRIQGFEQSADRCARTIQIALLKEVLTQTQVAPRTEGSYTPLADPVFLRSEETGFSLEIVNLVEAELRRYGGILGSDVSES